MTYSAEVLADTPLAYYRLGEASGTTAADSSGNARNATYAGSPGLGAAGALIGDANTAVNFDGSNDIASINDAAWMHPTAMSIEGWAQADAAGAITGYIASKTNLGAITAANYQFLLYRPASTYNVGFICTNSTGTQVTIVSTGTELSDNDYHHVVGTFDGTTARLYVDGVQVASAALSGTLSAGGTNPLRIGGFTSGTARWWDGRLDEIAYYDHALSAARIASHYAAASPALLGTPGETDTAHGIVGPVILGTPGEADAAGSLTTFSALLGTATETDAANGIASVPISTLGTAEETDTALPLTIPTLGDTSNRVGGRTRSGIGEADWTPAVEPPPPGLPLPHVYDLATAYEVTEILAGRPVLSAQQVQEPAARSRIIVGGKDVTYFRGIETPFPGYDLVEPFMFGPLQITLPQIAAPFERPGHDALRWCRRWAPVVIQRVDAEGDVVATDYRGLVVGHGYSGGSLVLSVAGELTGRAAMMDRQPPLFPDRRDIGGLVDKAVRETGLAFDPYGGPTTGIIARAFGGMSMLDYLHQLVALSWNRSGNRWTVMPTRKGVYRMTRKDRTTIDGTVYADDARTVADLDTDFTENPNRIFVTGVTPGGQRVRFGAYPGLKQAPAPPYPFLDDSPFGAGTTDADTDTGDGITVMVTRLRITKYLGSEDAQGGYDADVTRAVKELQRDADLDDTGDMDPDTWAALFDLSATGFSLRWSRILPAAERSVVRPWKRTASGAIIARNPAYDSSVPKVDRTVDMGAGVTRETMREWARAQLDDSDGTGDFTGTITFHSGGLIVGDHTPGDPITAADLMHARDLRPGMNLRLPLFAGGITVHVAAVKCSAAGTVSADVDTRARDAMEVWEVNDRNRESRRSPYRQWVKEHRASMQTKDALAVWDEVGGELGADVTVYADQWTVFPVVAGQEGTVRALRLATSPAAEYTVAVFGKRIRPSRLAAAIGNPLTHAGSKRWAKESVRTQLDRDFLLLYAAGSDEEPCGYFPKVKTDTADDDVDPAPLTGRWEDDASFSYHTTDAPVLWVAVYADRQTTIPAGRIMWPQLEAGV